jgi:hypothetical protein
MSLEVRAVIQLLQVEPRFSPIILSELVEVYETDVITPRTVETWTAASGTR